MTEQEAFKVDCRDFVAVAFRILHEAHVLPVPFFSPYLRVGRDYFGDQLDQTAEFERLTSRIERSHPDRFAEPLSRQNPEFAWQYVYSFLEAAIAGCAITQEPFDVDSHPVATSIQHLKEVLGRNQNELVCCRVVSHIRTYSSQPMWFGNIEVVPEVDKTRDHLNQEIANRISGAASAYNRERPYAYDPPLVLLVNRDHVGQGTSPYDAMAELSAGISSFLLYVRILYGATSSSYWQVTGLTSLIGNMHPYLHNFPGDGLDAARVRRTAVLGEISSEQIDAFRREFESLDVKRVGMAATSFDSAVQRFNRSFGPTSTFEKIVDLITALEGILLGGDKDNDAISLRLRVRAVALLADDQDSPSQINGDLMQLYSLRSSLVHGGNLKEARLRAIIAKVSTVTNVNLFGVAMFQAVYRLRDLVRRAILARICLGSPGVLSWPLASSTGPDVELISAGAAWREAWRSKLDSMGIGNAAIPARPAANFVSQDER